MIQLSVSRNLLFPIQLRAVSGDVYSWEQPIFLPGTTLPRFKPGEVQYESPARVARAPIGLHSKHVFSSKSAAVGISEAPSSDKTGRTVLFDGTSLLVGWCPVELIEASLDSFEQGVSVVQVEETQNYVQVGANHVEIVIDKKKVTFPLENWTSPRLCAKVGAAGYFCQVA